MIHIGFWKGWWTALVVLTAGGCCIPSYVSYDDVPSWVYKIPSDEKHLYVVGSAARGPTMQATVDKARENALYNLSQAISFQLFSRSAAELKEDFSHVQEIRKVKSKTLIRDAQRADMWVDREGVTGQFQVYILMKIPRNKLGR